MVYTDAHRLFLQIITAKRILLGPEVKTTYEKCCAKFNVKDDSLQDFIKEINTELEKIHLAIRKAIQEEYSSDCQCYVLVNYYDNDATRMCSTYTPQELALFRKIMEGIIQSEEGCIHMSEAINMVYSLETKMKIGDSEAVIHRLVQDGWLLQHDDGGKILYMSALSTTELMSYIEEQHEGFVQKCFFCKLISLRGHSCPKCDLRVHRQCGKKFWNRNGSGKKSCPDPKCGETWFENEDLPNKRLKT